jgi:hypothetical protein
MKSVASGLQRLTVCGLLAAGFHLIRQPELGPCWIELDVI